MLRIGEPHYLSTLPLYHSLRKRQDPDLELFPGGLTELSTRLANKELDAGPVSVVEYLAHPDRFRMLPNVALSSVGRSLCVTLFSRRPAYELADARIAVPATAPGPVALLRWLMREMYRLEPTLVARTGGLRESLAEHDAVLLFQDAALEAHAGTADLFQIWDLGEAWWQITNTPFIYMLWAARSDLLEDDVAAITLAFDAAKANAPALGGEILAEAQRRSAIPRTLLEGYFNRFRYDFTTSQQEGLEAYRQALATLVTV